MYLTDLLLASIGLICSLSSGMVNRPKRKLPTPLSHGHDPDDEVGDFGGSLKIRMFQIIRLNQNMMIIKEVENF